MCDCVKWLDGLDTIFGHWPASASPFVVCSTDTYFTPLPNDAQTHLKHTTLAMVKKTGQKTCKDANVEWRRVLLAFTPGSND